MKEKIKRLSDKLDALNHKDSAIIQQGNVDLIAQHVAIKEQLAAEIKCAKNTRLENLSTQAKQLSLLPFSRPITKKEQANMGTLKKTARGLIVVHPMTALGREMGLKEMTGYAKKTF